MHLQHMTTCGNSQPHKLVFLKCCTLTVFSTYDTQDYNNLENKQKELVELQSYNHLIVTES